MGKWHKNSKFVCSAVFGTEIWPAAEYGRTMYTIRQRVGPLLMKMQKRYGRLFTNSFISYSRLAVINFFCYIINFLVLSRLNKKRHIHRRTTALQHLQLSSHWCRKSNNVLYAVFANPSSWSYLEEKDCVFQGKWSRRVNYLKRRL